MAYGVRMRTRSWGQAAEYLSRTVSWTSDLGTEAGLWTVSASLSEVFGNWAVRSDGDIVEEAGVQGAPDADDAFDVQPEIGGHFADPEPLADFEFAQDGVVPELAGRLPQEAVDAGIDFTKSLFISGTLHVISNATKDLHNALAGLGDWVDNLRHLARLLSKQFYRDRLFERCFNTPELRLRRAEVEKFSGAVYEGGWSSVADAVHQILPLEALLRAAWDRDAYHGGRPLREPEGRGDHGLNIEAAHEAIVRPKFWAHAAMVDELAGVLEKVSAWAEACMCHTDEQHRPLRQSEFMRDYGVPCCPLRTLQAASFAAGRHFEIMDIFSDKASMGLLLDTRLAALDASQQAEVMSDFARGRAHIVLCMRVTLSFWRQVPWVCCGVAHPDEAVARSCATRALLLYDRAAPGLEHHAVSARFCSADSPCREQLRRFAAGEIRLQDAAELEFEAAKLRFVVVSERWIEGIHAQTKRYYAKAHNASALHVAYRSLWDTLQERIDDRPEILVELARQCVCSVRCPLSVCVLPVSSATLPYSRCVTA